MDPKRELSPRQTAATRHACATWIGRSRLAIIGGRDGSDGIKAIHIYDFARETWTVGKDLITRRYSHGCTTLALNNGSRIVVVAGGKETYQSGEELVLFL